MASLVKFFRISFFLWSLVFFRPTYIYVIYTYMCKILKKIIYGGYNGLQSEILTADVFADQIEWKDTRQRYSFAEKMKKYKR